MTLRNGVPFAGPFLDQVGLKSLVSAAHEGTGVALACNHFLSMKRPNDGNVRTQKAGDHSVGCLHVQSPIAIFCEASHLGLHGLMTERLTSSKHIDMRAR